MLVMTALVALTTLIRRRVRARRATSADGAQSRPGAAAPDAGVGTAAPAKQIRDREPTPNRFARTGIRSGVPRVFAAAGGVLLTCTAAAAIVELATPC
ncbi:hypothetical protein [Nocardia huaxiensis]|uniref:Uncharacterized protein n=1 Tax=Nocardia huaxiensis TaxID=2755382 RepID=A0A7D6ZAP7_9NOCA|nr:hypothetical protein [Nocardia huaxiensis]QLY29138.1 hypothetical protein H0264_28110 [Nocardia huaxiensis]UFS97369.1 hypothetical protein LPY97_05490 [Nocardia huaxiensis]